jgi:hypothetical protein
MRQRKKPAQPKNANPPANPKGIVKRWMLVMLRIIAEETIKYLVRMTYDAFRSL